MSQLRGPSAATPREVRRDTNARESSGDAASEGVPSTSSADVSGVDADRPPALRQGIDRTRLIEEEVRAETDRLLLVRTRIMLAMVAAGVASGLGTDL